MVVEVHFHAHGLHVGGDLGAQVHQAVGRRSGEVALLVLDLLAEVDAGIDAGVPGRFFGVEVVEGAARLGGEAHAVEDEELGLGAEVGDVADAGALEVGEGLVRHRARVAGVALAGARVVDVAEEADRGLLTEGVDEGGRGIGLDAHVGLLDALPAADRAAVEGQAIFEQARLEAAGDDREVLEGAEHVAEHDVDVLGAMILGELQGLFNAHCETP